MAVASQGSSQTLNSDDPLSALESVEIPAVDVKSYIETLYSVVEDKSTWMTASELISRLLSKGIPLTKLTVHRILLACLVIADKTLNDYCLDNSSYAKIGLVSLCDLNYMEKITLIHLRWELYVSHSQVTRIGMRLHNYSKASK